MSKALITSLALSLVACGRDPAAPGMPTEDRRFHHVGLHGPGGLVSAGERHSCAAARIAHLAHCWGDNSFLQLGRTGPNMDPEAQQVSGRLSVVEISAGWWHTCAVLRAGDGYCWGSDSLGVLGHGKGGAHPAALNGVPQPVAGGFSFYTITAGVSMTCAVSDIGEPYCWGDNTYGQLGRGSFGGTDSVPSLVVGGHIFMAISGGGAHVCALTGLGAAYCWGRNADGQIGRGTVGGMDSVPQPVFGGLTFAGITAGGKHSCAVTGAGDAYCWGLLQGPSGSYQTPVPQRVLSAPPFAMVDAGGEHTCGVTFQRAAYCWGNNGFGQFGNGTTVSDTIPQAVAGGFAFTEVSAGGLHSCAVRQNREVYCWGRNLAGQLGDQSFIDRLSPVRVQGLP